MSKSKREQRRLADAWKQVAGPQVRAANDYLDWCRTVLGLPHWDIWVAVKPCSNNAHASILPEDQRHIASINLSRDWINLEPAEQAMVLLHEVLHVSHHRLTNVMRLDARHGMSQKRYDHLAECSRREAELMVDQLATALTKSLSAVHEWERIRSTHDL
jgi:hypothetical protein